MKRDMDLVREILLAVEDNENGFKGRHGPGIPGYNPETIAYHVEIMEEAGLLDARIDRVMGSPVPIISLRRMTWAGHEFLDAVRGDSWWQKVKEKTKESTGGLALDMVKQTALALARQALD